VGNAAIRDRLQTALRAALRARDKTAASALRSALAAIDNASAVAPEPAPGVASGPHFAGAAVGLGAGEAPRRGLTAGEAERIVRAEIAEREAAATGYERAGHADRAARLRREAAVLQSAVDPAGTAPAEAAAVAAFWQDLGLPGLVDIHTHFMPPNVLAKVWAFFEGGRAGMGRAWPIAYRLPEEERVALLRAFGVRRFSALLYPHKPGMAAWLNSWAAGFAARTPDALHSATFFAEPGAGAYVAEAIGAGARLFKAHLQVGAYDPRDETLDAVWGALAEARVPVVVHCGSGPMPGRFTGPGPISAVLARHPRLTMIVAHLGAPEYGEFLDLAERYPGVHLDTTMAFTSFMERLAPFPAALRPRLAAAAGRILLGSDFPNIPYPYLHQLEALGRLDLGAAWLRAVCHDNAVRLLGL
jgi:uncharacterized protein YqeY